jgi:TPR repeat protein
MSTILKRAVVARALFTLVLAIAPLTAPYAQDPTTSILSEAKTATTMEDLGRALDLYRQAAEAGSTDAAIQLARLHLEVGKGLEMDYGQARLWAQRAADAEKAPDYFLRLDADSDLKAARRLSASRKATFSK